MASASSKTGKAVELLDQWRSFHFFFGKSWPYYARIAVIFIVNYINMHVDSWTLLVNSQTHELQTLIALGYLIYYYGNTAGIHISVLVWTSMFAVLLDFTNIAILLVQFFSSYADPKLMPSEGSMTTLAFALRLSYLGASLCWDILCTQKSFFASGKMRSLTEKLEQAT